jgi:serine/threonine-protein kinase
MRTVESLRAIGRYEVESVVGQGGMGRVLLARDSVLGRRVAIKIMRDDLGLPPEVRAAVIARMRQEARAAAAVSHPNMVTLHDMGEEEPVGLYLVFEYVEGPTLREAIENASPEHKTPSLRMKIGATGKAEVPERGALDPHDVVRIALEVAGALDLAHAAGVIHRDVKPENVLLSATGAKITDFGIARMPDSTLTLQSTVMGTPAYSAPETFSAAAFSARSDQFSLACTLYEALTGDRAFPGDDPVAVAAKVATEDPAPLRSHGGALDRASQVMLRGMAKDPARRFATCGDLADALADALEPTLMTAREPSDPGKHSQPPESAVLIVEGHRPLTQPKGIVLGVGALAIAGAGLYFGLGGGGTAEQPAKPAAKIEPTAADASVVATAPTIVAAPSLSSSASPVAPKASARKERPRPSSEPATTLIVTTGVIDGGGVAQAIVPDAAR